MSRPKRNETQNDDDEEISDVDSIPEEANNKSLSITISSKPLVSIKQKIPMQDIGSNHSSKLQYQ